MKKYMMADVDREEFTVANIKLTARVYGEPRPTYYRADRRKYDPRYEEKYYTKTRKQDRKRKLDSRRWD